MTQNIEYNFEVGDHVFYYDHALGGYSRGTVKQIDLSVFIENLILTKNVKYILQLTNGGRISINENASLLATNPPSVPSTPAGTITTQFKPGDKAWLTNNFNNQISYVTIAQTEIKKYQDTLIISYWVNPESDDVTKNETSVKISDSELFATSNDAFVDIGIIDPPSPTPLPSDTLASFLTSKTNISVLTLTFGSPVSITDTGGVVPSWSDVRAKAFLGFVYDTTIPPDGVGRILLDGTINNTDAGWDDIISEGGLLQTSKKYYLAPNGKLTATPPTVGYIKQVGLAISPNVLDIKSVPGIKL